ncbi:YdiU family protein [Shimia sp.]|uniref:protein adenylyltransferase SelO n=1 Tax=Shimia sp. TaxID=1954381 RepID=UPI003562C919
MPDPARLSIPFDNSYARLPARLFTRLPPEPVPAPELLAFNAPLAAELGITGAGDAAELAAVFSGNRLPEGAEPLAQLYAGHQFGQWNPQLGDGRAILLGEARGRDIQLKGSGRTPYSRGGDGRAWLGPVLREYLVSEAMHALGVPTTRALAAVATGAAVMRETALPGAVLTRVAASHIRVGTFQVLAARRDREGLGALLEHACARHYPGTAAPLDFLRAVIARQVRLVTRWMGIGFIHGVMNTDNCAVSGETIDYGPCAFMDRYEPLTVFSSIDHAGRYAYGAQPDVVVWNMAQLATALLALEADPEGALPAYTEAVHAMPGLLGAAWTATLLRKIGISDPAPGDRDLAERLLSTMRRQGSDFTNLFAALAGGGGREEFTDGAEFDDWRRDWQARLATQPDPGAVMQAANPVVIPRNHRVEQMIEAAIGGDMAPFRRLLAACTDPFERRADSADLRRPPREDERVLATYCGT